MTPTYPNTARAVLDDQALTSPEVSEQSLWEAKFEAITGVSRIPEGDFVRLRELLSKHEDQDSYLTSPIYYSFTGRKGLWVYEKGNSFILACWHPNVPDQVLIFPQLNKSGPDLIKEMLEIINEPPAGIRIARAKLTDTVERQDLHSETRHVALEKIEETVLDWKYPVRILSTAKVAELTGRKFMKVRNHMRKLQKHSVKVLPFDAINHSRALENLLHRWANYHAANREEYNLLYAPYETIFSQSIDKPPGLSGLMIFVDGGLQAVSLWDVSNASQKTANIYVNFCNTDFRGLSEFSLVESCKALRNQGINLVNLGGSETASLDDYKKKFDPAYSIDLCSIKAKIDDDCRYTAKRAIDPLHGRKLVLGSLPNG